MKLPPISTPDELNAETLFRFQVVSQVLVREATGSSRASAVAEVASAVQLALNGQWRQVSTRTLYRWLAVFALGGYRALAPAQRVRTDSSVVLSEDFCDFLREQKKDDPEASIPELILRARVLGVIESDAAIDRSTVYRACKRMGLPVQRRKKQRGRDSRRFAFPHYVLQHIVRGMCGREKCAVNPLYWPANGILAPSGCTFHFHHRRRRRLMRLCLGASRPSTMEVHDEE